MTALIDWRAGEQTRKNHKTRQTEWCSDADPAESETRQILMKRTPGPGIPESSHANGIYSIMQMSHQTCKLMDGWINGWINRK